MRPILPFLLSALLTGFAARAQAPAPPAEAIYTYAEQMPIFRVRGTDSLLTYVQRRVRYPAAAIQAQAQGRVFIGFVVNKLGQVEQAKVVKGVHPALDQEALRVVQALPPWQAPGKQGARPVSVALTIPVAFQLRRATPQEELALAQRAAGSLPTAGSAAYTGPRYPGGPDSLRALLARTVRAAGPAPAGGRLFVEFTQPEGGTPRQFKLLELPRPKNKELEEAGRRALTYLQTQMAPWQPGTPDAQAPASTSLRLLVPLDFSSPATALPYVYPDQNPVFADLLGLLRRQSPQYYNYLVANPSQLVAFDSSPRGLGRYLQSQVRYPPEALRQQQQGQVLAYFEISETGTVENPSIVASAGNALDEEVLSIIRRLPPATTPAQLQGRPVRVFYMLPINFKIQ